MFKEAFRLGTISKDTASLVQKLQERTREKGMLTIDEARSLLNPELVTSLWGKNTTYYCINLIACTTGMRLGEIQALRLQDYCKDYITVSYSWDRKYGLKEPKCKSFRAISIPKYVSSQLEEQILESKVFKSDDLIFHGKLKNKAIDHKEIVKQLYLALSKIGISEEQRKKRRISFHSWRHFFNTFMRGKVPDSKLQKVTGHRSLEMTELYDHQQLEDLQEIRIIQETMIL
jgi:integrase